MGIDVESTHTFHKPVPPCATGEGYPYAPADWPNPGDVWTWKVGNKITPAGYYVHRSLIVPKRLQKTPTRKIWLGSKTAVVQFLATEFPDADIDAFFASFTWEIPAEIGSAPEVKDKGSTQNPVPEKKSAPEKTTPKPKSKGKQNSTSKEKPTPKEKSTPKIEAELGSNIAKRTRSSGSSIQVSTGNAEEEMRSEPAKRKKNSTNSHGGSVPKKESAPKKQEGSRSPILRKTRNSTRKQLLDQDAAVSTDLALVEGASAGELIPFTATNENNDEFDLDSSIHRGKDAATSRSGSRRKQKKESNSQINKINEMSSEDFDNYINSLDDILCHSVPKAATLESSLLETDEDFFARARAELSSLLSQDLSSLITSDKLPIVTDLSSRLRSDPELTLEELSILDLILEIPLVSDHLQNVKEVKAEARQFFADLDTNIALVSKLKNKYTLSKDKLAVLETENASNLPTLEEIDKQLAKLHSRRDELAKSLEENEAQIAELSVTQKRILNSLPKIVNEVKAANAEKAQWEVKQKEAEKQESHILAKFAPVEGFSFIRYQ